MTTHQQDVCLHPHPHVTRDALVPEQEEGKGRHHAAGYRSGSSPHPLDGNKEMTPSVTTAMGVKL